MLSIIQEKQPLTMSSSQLAEMLGFESKSSINKAIRKVFDDKIEAGLISSSLDVRGYVVEYHLPELESKIFIARHDKTAPIYYGSRERACLATIEQLLGVDLIRQFSVGNYRIDGYDKVNNVAYEIDEEQHFKSGALKAQCVERQKFIEEKLGCKFVRIKV